MLKKEGHSVENCVTMCYNRRSEFGEEMSREKPHICVAFFDGINEIFL